MQEVTFIALNDARWADPLVIADPRKGAPDIHWTGCWVSYSDNTFLSSPSRSITHNHSCKNLPFLDWRPATAMSFFFSITFLSVQVYDRIEP
jgi:hypothetical protein